MWMPGRPLAWAAASTLSLCAVFFLLLFILEHRLREGIDIYFIFWGNLALRFGTNRGLTLEVRVCPRGPLLQILAP